MALKEENVLAISGKKKSNVRKETSAVSGMKVIIVHDKNRTFCEDIDKSYDGDDGQRRGANQRRSH